MVSYHRSNKAKILALMVIASLLMPTSFLLVEAKSNDVSSNPIIDPLLALAIRDSPLDEKLPVVVYFPDGSDPSLMTSAISSLGLADMEIRHVFDLIPVVSLYATGTEIEALSKQHQVQGITLDMKRTILNDEATEYFALSSQDLEYEHFTETLEVDDMWAQGYFGNGTTIAVLDSGAQGDHIDLQGQLIGFRDLVGAGTDMNPDDGISAYDDNGHGTAVAWNAAGSGVASGGNFTGTAPGAKLLIIKVLDSDGAGEDSVIAEGIEFAVAQGVDVISISLGGPWLENPFIPEPSILASTEAVNDGVSVVIASGNSGPASFSVNSPGVTQEAITVGASAGSAGVIAFSSRGPVERTIIEPLGLYAKPDVVAPGSGVVSARWIGSNPAEYPAYEQVDYGANYTQWSGTSASAPQVAGLVALLEQKHPSLGPTEAKIALMAGATDLGVDSMEQGWGLPNVTLASEIIISGTGDLTIMTPRKYPTLPGTSAVQIVGEDRPDQNITIISTHSLGTVDVILDGNASQFVRIEQNTIFVGTGYNYLSIGLDVQNDLPLSSIGYYTGELVLSSGGQNITTLAIEFSITTYGGRLLVDMTHHDQDVDDPSAYRYFQDYLREQGIVLDQFAGDSLNLAPPITLSDLATTEAFMIMDTETAYGAGEIEALHEYVDDGGTLIVLSEYFNETTGQASFALEDYNRILEPYGIECLRIGIGEGPTALTGAFYGVDNGGAVETDPLMDGISNLYVLWGSVLSVDSSVAGARGLFWRDAEKRQAIVAVAESGEGQVIVISDGSTLYDDILYDAIRGEADNLNLLRNLASRIHPESPRIFDVELNANRIGEPANLTTYVFDDDLVDVAITVLGPNGEDITGIIEETLGYKYSTNFVLSSGGFFEVTITATDASDNVKTFNKIFLVPLDPADDLFITTVTFSLLAVVGASLLYVVIIRRTPKQKRRVDYLPESQPDEYTPPPSIS
ncbi:MAG: S8 family serine peptidase [Candidatus Thorarchaeota archaeon]